MEFNIYIHIASQTAPSLDSLDNYRLIGAMVKGGTYMAGCVGTGRERGERSQELVRGMNIKL
jgi:hypothetical protein